MSSSSIKMKPLSKNQEGGSSSKKKIETLSRNSSGGGDSKKINSSKLIPVKSAKSENVKDKGKSAIPATPVKKTRERKVYNLAGQKHDPPEEREPLRIFYESLSKQIPTSEMAEFWLMEHGLLSPERAKKAYEKKQRKQKLAKMGTPIKSTPIKSPPSSNRPESSNKQKLASKNGDIKPKKRVVEDSDDEVIGIPKRRKA